MNIGEFFAKPSAAGIGIAVLFAAAWLVPFRPLRLKKYPVWLVFIGGALVFAPSIAWVQVPLQNLAGNLIIDRYGIAGYNQHIFLLSIPVVLLSGMVQEGFKLLPTVFYWWSSGKELNPKLGLTLGAMAGAGFGLIETQWVINSMLASGFSWSLVETYGLGALAGFWERFFTTGFHISIGALAGWGLARGWGWQYYLLAAAVHTLLNYTVVLLQTGVLTALGTEVFIAVIALIVCGVMLWLRWRKEETPPALGEGLKLQGD